MYREEKEIGGMFNLRSKWRALNLHCLYFPIWSFVCITYGVQTKKFHVDQCLVRASFLLKGISFSHKK